MSKSILIAEDETVLRESLAELLAGRGVRSPAGRRRQGRRMPSCWNGRWMWCSPTCACRRWTGSRCWAISGRSPRRRR